MPLYHNILRIYYHNFKLIAIVFFTFLLSHLISNTKFDTIDKNHFKETEMTKREFIEKYEIADAMPVDPSRRSLPAEGFSMAIKEFLDFKFQGIVRLSVGTVSAMSILVSAEYVALFFKELFTEVYGRVTLDITVRSDSDRLTILVSSDEPLPIEMTPLRRLIKAARNAGFKFGIEENILVLSAQFSPTRVRRIYAVSVMDSRRIMLGKFVEIFCHGELMSAEPPKPVRQADPINRRGKNRRMI